MATRCGTIYVSALGIEFRVNVHSGFPANMRAQPPSPALLELNCTREELCRHGNALWCHLCACTPFSHCFDCQSDCQRL